MKKYFTVLLSLLMLNHLHAQVGIGTTTPNNSAQLDITATNRGFLMPRMTQAQRNLIPSPATGLQIYQTDATPGYYFWNGAAWVAMRNENFWGLAGNEGTDRNTNFIGTTDQRPLVFRTNGQQAGFIGDGFFTSTILGYQTGSVNGFENVFIGHQAANNNSGHYNVAIGSGALRGNTSQSNVAIGLAALSSGNTAYANVAVGVSSLRSNTSGENNTGVGKFSLYANQTGNNNTGIGSDALTSTTGSNNTALGANAARYNNTGSDNTALGSSAGPANGYPGLNQTTALGSNAIVNSDNATAIGFNARVGYNATNSMAIGSNASVGDFVSNTIRLGNAAIQRVEAAVNITATSDGRFKFNVTEDVKGLEFILNLRPVTYNMNVQALDLQANGAIKFTAGNDAMNESYRHAASIKRTGFIAQEVEKAALQTGYDFDGVVKPSNEKDHYALSYASFVVPLVKAIQEQQQIIESQKTRMEKLEKKLMDLSRDIEYLKSKLD